jgi:CHAD domain-containing protein
MKTMDLPTTAESGQPAVSLLLKGSPLVPSISQARQTSAAFAPTVAPRPQAVPASISICLAGSLRNRWVIYLGRRRQFEDDPSEEAVHELRVAVRRLMAQLDLFATVVRSEPAEKARRILKRSLKPLGHLRDLQVQRGLVEKELETFPELILFRDDLKKREHPRTAEAAAKVQGLKIQKFEKWISLMFQDLAEKTGDRHQASRLSTEVVRKLEKTHAAVLRQRRAIRPDNFASVHATRVAFKKFRYIAESLSPGVTGFDERQLAALASYQRQMGAIQDLEVIHASAEKFIRRYPAAEDFLVPFLRRLRHQRTRALAAFMQQADIILDLPLSKTGK